MPTNKELSFWASKKRQESLMNWLLYLVALAGATVFVIPLVWMIVTSLKTPDDIFTIPPKWIPVSEIRLNYEPVIKSQRSGKLKITKGEDGNTILTVENFSHIVPAVAKINVKDKQEISKGDVLAELPKEGIVAMSKPAYSKDKSLKISIIDKKSGLPIKSYNAPENAKFLVKEGDTVRPGQKLAHIGPQWINYAKAWAPEALDETFNRYLLNTV
ncbi:MAG TPA: hypothetical protein P5511_05240, partial [Candidatus Goldiibacteriota bacterium]|nr:hypothetical protein [Candidatus Goldiibacteriota bacterium]